MKSRFVMTMAESKIVGQYFEKVTFQELNSLLRKKLRRIADKISDDIITQYDFEQQIIQEIGKPDGKIIVTTVFRRKNENKSSFGKNNNR